MKKSHQIAIIALILGVVSFIFHLQSIVGEIVSREELMQQADIPEAYSTDIITGLGYAPSWIYFIGAIIYCSTSAIQHRVVRIVLCSFFVIAASLLTLVSIELYGVPFGPGVSETYFESNGIPLFLYISLLGTVSFSMIMSLGKRT